MKTYYIKGRFGVVKDFEKNNDTLLLEMSNEQIKALYEAMLAKQLKTNSYNGRNTNQLRAEVWKDKDGAKKVTGSYVAPKNNDNIPF